MYATKYKKLHDFDDITYPFNPRNPFSVYHRYIRDKNLIELLNKYKLRVTKAKILDIGCGYGNLLLLFLELGAKAENLYGIDLMDYRIERAKAMNPGIHYSTGNAESLEYNDQTFDIVLTFTLFSSILDEKVRCNIAREAVRVLKDGGYIIFYDNNLRYLHNHPYVRGIDKDSLMNLFPNCILLELRSVLSRYCIGSFNKALWLFNDLLELFPFFKTRYLALFKKIKKR
jgi:ubiquinone/menaquinone biosynthesis C-methylase UbiE